ncbi:site-specific integrase [Altererythrobacter lauratis]|uniref:Tyrosine recombinase XerC n=1 Tax=Alteraurantiacibacter lauratis TaxID=2054627 RepID=A0ABV7EI74_9SPHN
MGLDPKPKLTSELIDAIAKARSERLPAERSDTVAGLIAAYRRSPEWQRLAKTTKPTWEMWLGRIEQEFGQARLIIFEDRRVRGDILNWRDRWANKPRSADMAIQVLSRLLSWAIDRGLLTNNRAKGINKLYDHDRSALIWEQSHFDLFMPHASIEVREAVELAACTGLRRGDLIKLPWDAVGEHAIIWKTSKSRGKAKIVVPLTPEAKAILQRIKDRHSVEMATKSEKKRKPLPQTVLSNQSWQSWTASGFGSRFNDAKRASGIEVNFHDLRGTFATRCIMAGLTDQEVADILGWTTKDVASIRVKYVDQARAVVAIADRIQRVSL